MRNARMKSRMLWVLAAATFGLLYPYAIYPVLLAAVSRFRGRAVATSNATPSVAILVSAFNEETRILDKIANFDAIDYPAGKLDLWIGTDGSTDRTADLIRQRAHPRVHLLECPTRRGKTLVLNDLARAVQAEVLMFSDTNAFFRPDAVRRLVEPMSDSRVGLVSGRTVIRTGTGNVEVEGAYYRLESWLKAREGDCGWLAGADGAIYALRGGLYQDLPAAWINDLIHPCIVVGLGLEARLNPLAVSEEPAGERAGQEFDRQTRITAQSSYLLASQILGLASKGKWGMLWVLLSHKWMRWIAGLWILIGWLAIVWMSPILGAAALAAILALVLAWRGGLRAAALPVYFLLIHIAYLRGLGKAITGERYVTWSPRSG